MPATHNQSKLSDLCMMDETSIRKRIISKLILFICDFNYLGHPYSALCEKVWFFKIKQVFIDEIEAIFLDRNSYPNKQWFARQIILQFHSKLRELIEINKLNNNSYSLDEYDKYKNELLWEIIPIIDEFDTALLDKDFQKTIFNINSIFTTSEYISISIKDVLKTDLQNIEVLGYWLYVWTLFNDENILFNDKWEILLRWEYDYSNGFLSNDDEEYIIVKWDILRIDNIS